MTDARIDGVRVDVVIDTGSDSTLGNRALQKALGRRGKITVPTVMHSVTGQQMGADVATADRLEMQGLLITGVGIAYSDSPTFAHLGLDKKPAILLGMREMRAFPRIAIDFSARKVLFDLPGQGDPAYFGLAGDEPGLRGI
jgi:predicted aspartyl protease